MGVKSGVTRRVWVDPDDAAELTGKELETGRWYRGGQRVGAKEGKAAFREALRKKQVNMMLDVAVIEHFKTKAGGRGYQTLINQALREAIDRETLEQIIRRVIREEMKSRRKAA